MNKANRKFEVTFLESSRIILRPLTENDINKRYLSWINNKEVTEYMETGIFPTSLKDLQNFYNKIAKSKTDVIFAIVIKSKGVHIGNIKLSSINWIHRFADLGIMIGEKKYWGKEYGQEACKILLGYAFKKLNLNKIILGVYATHKIAIRAYQKVGFRIEGRLKKMVNLNGKYVDKIIMGITREDFNE